MGNEKTLQPKLPNKEDTNMIYIDKEKMQNSIPAPKKVSIVEKNKKVDKNQEVKTDISTTTEKEKSYFSYLKYDEDKLIENL
ncbi:hypothetical protein ACSLGF_14485 [Bacillus sp. A015]